MGEPLVTSGFLGSVGLLLDVVGAFFLAESFVLKRREEIFRETASYYDGNPFLLRSASYQAVEARSGFVHLAVGFLLQSVAYTRLVNSGPNPVTAACAAFAIVYWAIAFVVTRRTARWYSRRMVATRWGDSVAKSVAEDDGERLEELAVFFAPAFDLQRLPRESGPAFASRIVQNVERWKRAE